MSNVLAIQTTLSPAELESVCQLDGAIIRLLNATLRSERLTAARDTEISVVVKSYAPAIQKTATEMFVLEAQIEQYYRAHHEELETEDKKSVQRPGALLGMRSPTHPGLVPLNDKWTWAKIEEKLRELWNKKYFHKPKPPGIDKVKLKKDLDEAQLKACGLKLDDAERFYLELNRLAEPDQAPVALPEAA